MFYKMIQHARDLWYDSPECSIQSLIAYMENKNCLRDAQIDAIKTYLYLKIVGACKPLTSLFTDGTFNYLSLENEALTAAAREYLLNNPAAVSLYQYAAQKDEKGNVMAKNLLERIQNAPQNIDYQLFFRDVFYNVSYTDYLFSLPMGAGKTYLMAAFIYLDLYFAKNELDNPAFAHNFMLFAPSGLKSSVIPSLRTIQNFDPSWVLPEPAASEIKRLIHFEILDENKTASKSNRVKNPNVQKLASHQPYSDLFGLVAVTNAEKVILDRIEERNGQISFVDDQDEKLRFANELRRTIGEIPSLSIFIDEVHHAVSEDIRLRFVVNQWAEQGHINSVLGFSGTPYLPSPKKIEIGDLTVAASEISNIVYYYPLIDGIGNFLKRPVVKIAEIADSSEIIRRGVRAFLDTYKENVYPGGLTAKLGIYCGTIEKLETVVWPIVSQLVAEYGLPADCILKFHKGNKTYPQPADSQLEFDTLDQPFSRIRIVLLVQIGKEGWNCRSLTGIILSQEGDCPKNMVLQTSCRCLRQVQKDAPETALIYLNKENAEKLAVQLQKEQHTTLAEFAGKQPLASVTLNRYSRMDRLKLPPVSFYQLRVQYDTVIIEKTENTGEALAKAVTEEAKMLQGRILTTDIEMRADRTSADVITDEMGTETASFWGWLVGITKAGLYTLTLDELAKYESVLRPVYSMITYEKNGARYFSSKFDHRRVEENIRKAFCEKRTFETREEKIRQDAALLVMQHFSPQVTTDRPEKYYPNQERVEKIIQDDKGLLEIPDEAKTIISLMERLGQHDQAMQYRNQYSSHPQKDRSFHYLPYRTDSGLEKTFLEGVLQLSVLKDKDLEVYYNGDDNLTEFRITCYEKVNGRWNKVGDYVPDFLFIKRRNGQIHQALIAETKGSLYANDPKFQKKRRFMEDVFVAMNNEMFGYKRFDYLYIKDTMSSLEWQTKVIEQINLFFE